MQGMMMWRLVCVGVVMMGIGCSNGGQRAGTVKTEAAKADAGKAQDVAEVQSGKVIGIGGVFFKSAHRDEMREWYAKHLGIADKGQGAMLAWREKDMPEREHVTVWTVFPESSTYFDPSPSQYMINYIVDDMDAILARLEKEGVRIDPKRMNESYGKFAWIYDSDGNKIELWQPVDEEGKGQ